MSRATMRAALADFLVGVNGLDKMWAAEPRIVDFKKYGSGPDRAQAWLFIGQEREERIATGSPHAGKKYVTYTVECVVKFYSTRRDTVAAMHSYDVLIDAIKARLRSDPNAGSTPGVVFQAGEALLEGEHGIPVRDQEDGPSVIFGLVRFWAQEIITA